MTNKPTFPGILSPEEELLYEAALDLGESSIQELATKTKIPRTSCYSILEKLTAKNLVETVVPNGKTRKVIRAKSPSGLQDILHQKKETLTHSESKLQEELPRLEALYKAYDARPNIEYFDELLGIEQILKETYEADEIAIHCSGLDDEIPPEIETLIYQKYYATLAKKKISVREIQTLEHQVSPNKMKQNSFPSHQTKIHYSYPGISHVDKIIFGDKMALITFSLMNGIIIEHPMIANYELALFDQIWEALE